MLKWLGKNWLKLIIVISIIIGLVLLDRACQDDEDQEKIDANNEKISDLKKKNEDLEDEMYEAVKNAKAAEKIVAEKEAELAESALKIKELQKKRTEIVRVVAELPPLRLVEDLREILECAEIELKDDGILFSIECSRIVLTMISEFSLIKEELKETQFSLSASLEATQFQKMATWYFLGAAWSLGSQVLNYKVIIKKQDENFSLLKKQKKKSWLDGAWKGFLAGVAFVMIINLARGR
ncbi:MAG: hypothetical protein KAT69_10680 [Candidatus Aminicenantes bacterium]|nr:hypothetical protein [Candidatus Aminicenantes bacterium]